MLAPTLHLLTPAPTAADVEPARWAGAEVVWGRAAAALAALPEGEAQVLRLRFGLTGRPSLPVAAVARELDLSPNRVRQIEANALRKLRHRHPRSPGSER